MFTPSQLQTPNPNPHSAQYAHAVHVTNEAANAAVRKLTTASDQVAYFSTLEKWAGDNAAAINAGLKGAAEKGKGAGLAVDAGAAQS